MARAEDVCMSDRTIKTEIVTHEEAGARLDRWVKRRMSLTQGEVEKLLRTGQIRVDGARAKSCLLYTSPSPRDRG